RSLVERGKLAQTDRSADRTDFEPSFVRGNGGRTQWRRMSLARLGADFFRRRLFFDYGSVGSGFGRWGWSNDFILRTTRSARRDHRFNWITVLFGLHQ